MIMAGGRPQKDIDKKLFENLCCLQCTQKEMLAVFEVSDKTLAGWCRRTYGKSFSEIFSIKRQKGLMSLRRAQFKLAEKSAAMAIHLGINYLGQYTKDNWQRHIEEELLKLKKDIFEREDF